MATTSQHRKNIIQAKSSLKNMVSFHSVSTRRIWRISKTNAVNVWLSLLHHEEYCRAFMLQPMKKTPAQHFRITISDMTDLEAFTDCK